MTEEWIVRVQGKEYGPVDTDELREWRREGRLIPANEVRRVEEERWFPAGELPEVFADEERPEPELELEPQPPPLPQHFEIAKSFSQIVSETFRIYRRGILPLPDFRFGWGDSVSFPAVKSATDADARFSDREHDATDGDPRFAAEFDIVVYDLCFGVANFRRRVPDCGGQHFAQSGSNVRRTILGRVALLGSRSGNGDFGLRELSFLDFRAVVGHDRGGWHR